MGTTPTLLSNFYNKGDVKWYLLVHLPKTHGGETSILSGFKYFQIKTFHKCCIMNLLKVKLSISWDFYLVMNPFVAWVCIIITFSFLYQNIFPYRRQFSRVLSKLNFTSLPYPLISSFHLGIFQTLELKIFLASRTRLFTIPFPWFAELWIINNK